MSKKLPIWKDFQKDPNATEEVVKKRMKTDRDGVLKRLRSRARAQIRRDPKTNQLVPIVPGNNAALKTEVEPPPQHAWID